MFARGSGRSAVLERRHPGGGEGVAHLARNDLGEDAGDLLRCQLLTQDRNVTAMGPHDRRGAGVEEELGALPEESFEDRIEPGHGRRVYVKPPRCSPV